MSGMIEASRFFFRKTASIQALPGCGNFQHETKRLMLPRRPEQRSFTAHRVGEGQKERKFVPR